jgi:AraC family transcriptional regulator
VNGEIINHPGPELSQAFFSNFMIENFLPESTVLKRGQFIGALCKEVDLPDFSIKEIVDRTEGEIPRHTHEDAHFLFILNGHYLTSARDVGPVSTSSTIIFNPPDTTHRDHFHARGGRCLAVSLKAESLAGRQRQVGLINYPVGFAGGEASWLGWKLYKEFHDPDEVSGIVMTGLVLEMLGHIWRRRAATGHAPPSWLRVAHELIHDRFTEPLSVKEIAQAVGAHPVYFVRAFRKHYRLTFGEYLRQLRVEFACRQISNTRTPLSQIAAAAGFYDQSHFTRTFKQLTGMTPHQYRSISLTGGLSDTSNLP